MKKRWGLVLCVAALCAVALAAGSAVRVVQTGQSGSLSATTIIIDAGHGGFDGGAVGADGTIEKDINLAISLQLKRLAELYGYEVIMVRDSDTAVSDEGLPTLRQRKVSDIHNRLALTKAHPGALYIGIHQNKFPQGKYWGAQVFYGTKDSDSRLLAQCLQDNLREQLQPENHREIKPAEKNLYILSNTTNPAVLIECGFLSNPEECARLGQADYQQRLAWVILTALAQREQQGEGSAPTRQDF